MLRVWTHPASIACMRHEIIKRPRLTGRRHRGAWKIIGAMIVIGWMLQACQGAAHAAEVTPPVTALCSTDSDCEARGFDGYYGDPCDAACEAGADPTTFYVVPDVDNDPTAACLLGLDWTGHAGDTMEAIYAPTVVIAACKRAPVGTHPLSTDDVSPVVWRELVAIYGVDLADPTDPIVFSVPGVAHALSVIDDSIGR